MGKAGHVRINTGLWDCVVSQSAGKDTSLFHEREERQCPAGKPWFSPSRSPLAEFKAKSKIAVCNFFNPPQIVGAHELRMVFTILRYQEMLDECNNSLQHIVAIAVSFGQYRLVHGDLEKR